MGQDSVVFMGRRSFRMELVEAPGEDAPGVPRRSSEIPTEKIFDRDRDAAAEAVLASLRSKKGVSSTTLVTLCSTTFVLGIALTLMVSGRPPRRPPIELGPATQRPTVTAAPIPAAPPAAAEPVVVELPPPPPPAIPATRRPPLVRPPRAVRAARAPRTESPAAKPWVDPFAE
jgi:hypothetical protein